MGSNTKPDFAAMTGPELLDAYNTMAGAIGRTPRTCRFRSREEGIRLCTAISARVPVLPLAKVEEPSRREGTSDDRVILLLATENPRREGTAAHMYFSKIVDGETVGAYLRKFESDKEKRDARQWLGYSKNQGYIKIESASE